MVSVDKATLFAWIVVLILIPALPSKFAVPTTSPLSAIALAVASVAADPEALPVNAPINVAAVTEPELGLYVNPLSCVAAVNAAFVTEPTYINLSASVLSVDKVAFLDILEYEADVVKKLLLGLYFIPPSMCKSSSPEPFANITNLSAFVLSVDKVT